MQEQPMKQPRAYLTLRALCAFAVCAVVGVGIYFFSLHHHADVAEWSSDGNREALVYEKTTYYLWGESGDEGLPRKDYETEELKGEIKPDSFFDPAKPVLVWTVKGKDSYLAVVDGDECYIYGTAKPTQAE